VFGFAVESDGCVRQFGLSSAITGFSLVILALTVARAVNTIRNPDQAEKRETYLLNLATAFGRKLSKCCWSSHSYVRRGL
jgi:hypothetical protein